jgi:hypothetical protein
MMITVISNTIHNKGQFPKSILNAGITRLRFCIFKETELIIQKETP